MNFEYEDYRKHEPEDIGRYPYYYVPARFVRGYLFKLVFFFFVLPIMLFGAWFTSLSTFFLYFMMYDVLEYFAIKQRIKNGE